MSAFGGIHYFDNAPIDDEILTAMERGLAARGPDGGGCFKSGPVAMVYRAFHTNKESRAEIQPLVSSSGHILCWDGRLDNRDELISALRDPLRGDCTDAAIVLAAFQRWGRDFLPRMVGDFALSLWDPASMSLLLGRDVIGSRDLYFQKDATRIMWSTDLALLLDLSGVALEVDDEYIAGYLTRLPEPHLTPFKKVDAVPPAHAALIKDGEVQVQRFWGLNPSYQVRYKTDSEYEEHFRQLFRQAVRCCLRADCAVWSDLSGGLDSSSIVCMADELIRNGEVQLPAFETVSCIRDQSPTSNEIRFIRYVEERIGVEGRHLAESGLPVLRLSDYEPSIIPNALNIFASYHNEVNELMSRAGARVRLCGNGGDEILHSIPDPTPELTDLLACGNILQLLRGLRIWGHDRKKPYIKLFWEDALLPILPRRLRLILNDGPVKRLPAWYDRQFVKRAHLRELAFGPRDPFGFDLPSSRGHSINFLSAVRESSAGYLRVLQDIDIRLPFLHRPLVEFMQAIPREQRARPGETRSLQRRALRDLLPPETLARKGKGNPIESLYRAVSREYAALHLLLTDSYVARYGYLDQVAVSTALERMRYGDQRALELLRIIPLELWLRSLQGRRPLTKTNAAAMGSPVAQPATAR